MTPVAGDRDGLSCPVQSWYQAEPEPNPPAIAVMVCSLPVLPASANVYGFLRIGVMPMFRVRSLMSPMFIALVASASAVGAAELPRVDVQGASGLCRAATAAFAAGTRYRPLGLANESAGQIFVTCNWQGDDHQDSVRGAKRLTVAISNNGSTSRAYTCTLVNGHQTGASVYATYVPKTITIAAGAGAEMAWVPSEVSNASASGIDRPSLSCVLPASSTIQYIGREYNEDVGA
jgi:hypothetical protein